MAIELAGYRIHEEVYQSNNTIIYRGQRLRDAARVLIKVLKSNNPSPNRVARLRREFEIGRDMQAAGGIEYHALEPYNNGWALIMEDFPGVTLREAFSERKLNAPSFLETGIHICEQLTHIHQLGVIHKDIKPANILIDPRTGAVKFIDFGISSRLSRENPGVVHPGKLEGTLAYLAPEQTGRVNRSVDSRADLYSLGITFYELISGQLPFPGNDPMEIIHAHIAREVIPPEHFTDASPVPAAIQRILARLLAKSPEDRYQSAAGVRLDLEACAQFLQDGDSQSLMQFEPGRFDISDTLQIPQKLYGRENEIRSLLHSCTDIQSGMARMLTVAGSSGVGKSSLIKEIHQVVARDGGFFLSGKFEQFRRDEPYNALIQAFQEVVRQILTESRESIQHWKERLVEALSRNGQLIIDVIPEVEHILGEQNAPPELSPTEAQNRFQLVFLNFIRVFAAPEHPLFLFLDDMQWADTATLNLLRNLLTDPESGHILIVGAYRDNEVNQVHPLALLFDDLNTSTSAVKEIKLQPLKIKDVYRLLADTLFFPECPEERIDSWVEEYIQARAPHADSKENPDAFGKAEQGMHRMEPPPGHELVEIIFKRTEGNPFFVAEYIKNLAHENLITFSPGERRWTWDLKNIRMRGVGDDVITMLTGQIQVLPSDTRRAICHASGLGGRFSLRMLALVLDQPAHTVADLLEPALQAGLITPRDDAYKYITRFSDQETTGRVQYTFIHDRVQHAAYDLLDDKTREQMHLRIGESLLTHLSHEEQDERIIIITNHLIKARELITENEKKLKLSELCLTAGLRAKKSTAYESAVRFLHIGLESLPGYRAPGDIFIPEHYDLWIAFHRELGECYYVSGDMERADRHFDLVLQYARTGLEKIKIYEIRIAVLNGTGEYLAAVIMGLEALREMGIRLPADPSGMRVQAELRNVRRRLRRQTINGLIDLPADASPERQATMRLLMNVSVPAYRLSSALFPLIVARMVNLSLRHGNTHHSAYAYTAYGMYLTGEFGDLKNGFAFGRLGLDLLEKTQNRELKSRVYYLYAATMLPWKNHVSRADHYLLEAYQAGLETGDLQSVSAAIVLLSALPLWSGNKRLSSMERLLEKYNNAIHKSAQQYGVDRHMLAWQYILHMQGAAKNKSRVTGERFDEESRLNFYRRTGNAGGQYHIYLIKSMLATLFGRYEEGIEFAVEAKKFAGAELGSPSIVYLDFFHALSIIQIIEELNQADARAAIPMTRRLNPIRQRLAALTEECPENFAHLSYLVEAEYARINKDYGNAIELYDRAAHNARLNDFSLYDGLACELAARFYLSLDKSRFAAIYLRDARQAYLNCRATARASELEIRYESVFNARANAEMAATEPVLAIEAPDAGDAHPVVAMDEATLTHTLSAGDGAVELDNMSIIKASQTIAGEIHLPALLERMLMIVMENAGAQRGAFILESEGRWLIQAQGSVRDAQITVLENLPYEESALIAVAIARLVERTGESIVLSDASADERFQKDAYVKEHRPRSVLCMPIKKAGRVVGILYLENNSARGAFTAERMRLLDMLSSQIATSVENATLYTNLEKALEQERLAKQAQIELNRASTRFVPSAFLTLLGQESLVNLRIGENTSEQLAVMFADIRSFTSLSEKMSPSDNFRFINSYLKRMGPVVREHEGFIDKYIGDAIMALFPSANDGVAGAVSMLRALRNYNEERERDSFAQIEIGIGIHSGPVMLGIIGEEHRLEGTVIGDTVNLASRLEGLTKIYGAPLVISGDTLEQLKDSTEYETRVLDRVRVKGKNEPVEIVEILNVESEPMRALKNETRSDFNAAVQLYRSGDFSAAERAFLEIHHKNREDRAVMLFIQRARTHIKKGTPGDWIGYDSLSRK